MDIMITMNDNNEPVTTSRDVAAALGVDHDDVIQVIENLECSVKFSRRNFTPSDYISERGKEYKQYNITKDGIGIMDWHRYDAVDIGRSIYLKMWEFEQSQEQG